MIEIFLVLFVVVVVVTICLHHHSMKKQLYDSSDCDARMVRDAAQYCIRAANTTNPLIAMIDVVSAIQILENLLKRHSPSTANNLTGVNVTNVLEQCYVQRNRILQDLCKTYPDLLPKHKLSAHAGFSRLKDRDETDQENSDSEASSSSSDGIVRRTKRYKHG